ncbi:hypothetical protein COL940_012218 [Colletotrichum noveboracense]|nr:hypothetical protein COL940_012218 [Colletotrichum noveboracense]
MSRTLKVGIIGPKGQAGSCVVDELLARGHSVVGISRSPPEQWPNPDKGTWSSVSVDIHKEHTKLVEIFSSGFDAIVSCYGPSLKVISDIYSEAVEGHGRIKTVLLASTHDGPFIIVGVRTGEYKVFVDSSEDPAVEAANGGIYNEDMAVAIVDEVENNKLAYKHWSCTGPIGLGKW